MPQDFTLMVSISLRHRLRPVLLALTFLLASCRSAPLPPPDLNPRPPRLKTITYNVNFVTAHIDEIVKFLHDSDADLVFLQESGNFRREIESGLAMRFPHRWQLPHDGGMGMAILSRFEIVRRRELPAPAGWAPAQNAAIMSPLGAVQVLNVHLRPSLSDAGKPTAQAYAGGSTVRRNEIRMLLKSQNAGEPLIVAGDFNEGEGSKATQWLRQLGFGNALSPFDKSSPTWRWKFWGIPLSKRFDHIYFNQGLRCTGSRVFPLEYSDHFPVMAVFAAP